MSNRNGEPGRELKIALAEGLEGAFALSGMVLLVVTLLFVGLRIASGLIAGDWSWPAWTLQSLTGIGPIPELPFWLHPILSWLGHLPLGAASALLWLVCTLATLLLGRIARLGAE